MVVGVLGKNEHKIDRELMMEFNLAEFESNRSEDYHMSAKDRFERHAKYVKAYENMIKNIYDEIFLKKLNKKKNKMMNCYQTEKE
jgi:hypothetical protein